MIKPIIAVAVVCLAAAIWWNNAQVKYTLVLYKDGTPIAANPRLTKGDCDMQQVMMEIDIVNKQMLRFTTACEAL